MTLVPGSTPKMIFSFKFVSKTNTIGSNKK
jgi:hypothetical protein